jgi:hypothetical protein
MRRIIYLLLLIILINNSKINAQANLVMNPSFEEDSFCTDLANGVQSGHCKYWSCPTLERAHYFLPCANDFTGFVETKMPINIFGFQLPRTGIGYTGIATYVNWFDGNSYRGYMTGLLRDSLISGKKYAVRYYINKGEQFTNYRYCQSNIGIYFSDSNLYFPIETNIPIIPQFQNDTNNVLNDTISWQKIEGSFIANGGERYFTIGNFDDNAHTKIFDCFNNGADLTQPGGYLVYYLDDVSIIDPTINDTVQLCMNDSIYLQGAWRKGAGMYYDTVAGMPYRKYIQPVSYASTHTLQHYIGKPGVDSFKTAYFWSRIFAGKDTTFRVTIPSVYGCDSVIICRLQDSSTVGIRNPSDYFVPRNDGGNLNLVIYPNPSSDIINIDISIKNQEPRNTNDLKIMVYDFMGQEVGLRFRQAQSTSPMTGGALSYQLDISKLSSGMYFVRVIDKKNKFIGSGKFIKSNSF